LGERNSEQILKVNAALNAIAFEQSACLEAWPGRFRPKARPKIPHSRTNFVPKNNDTASKRYVNVHSKTCFSRVFGCLFGGTLIDYSFQVLCFGGSIPKMSSQAVTQNEIVRKNTAAIADMQRKVTEARTLGGRIADAITDFTGSMVFVYLHVIWFSLWVLLNVGLIHIPYVSEFDPFPFGLLTMIVSLEAIFLSTFVLISQNRLACASEKRAELDLQVNLLAEQKATKVLEVLDQITQQLDQMSSRFNFNPDPEVKALKVSPHRRDG
jgi:uncharacterized membrane protein